MTTATRSGVGSGRRFHIGPLLEKGGEGMIYRATQAGIKLPVALKVVRDELTSDITTIDRLRREAETLAQLGHPSIVKVHDFIRVDERWAIVMELVDGVNLRHLIARDPVPPGPALEIIAEIASALDEAGKKVPDLVHLDVKPENIMLTSHGAVKLLDFGIARSRWQPAGTLTRSAGTLGYWPPETYEGIAGSERDIFALGIVLLELLMGERAGQLPAQADRYARHREELFTRARDRQGLTIEPLLDLARRMIAFERGERPQAQDVVRSRAKLLRQYDGESLRDWAARTVPLALDERPLKEGAWSGRTVTESPHIGFESTPPAPTPVPAKPEPRPLAPTTTGSSQTGSRPALLAVLTVLIAALLVMVLRTMMDGESRQMPEAGPVPPVIQDTLPPPEPLEPEPPVAHPVEPPLKGDGKQHGNATSPSARIEPKAKKEESSLVVAPAPAVSPSGPSLEPEPATGRISVKGDASAVACVMPGELQQKCDEKTRYSIDQSLPAGTYTIVMKDSGDSGGLFAGCKVEVKAGDTIGVNVNYKSKFCR